MEPTAVQAIPRSDFKVYVYFDDGKIVLYDVAPLLNQGVFKKISTIKDFIEKCTILNGTLAWDIGGNYDIYNCIDIAPDTIYAIGVPVTDPLAEKVA